jgi:hypothetical protein
VLVFNAGFASFMANPNLIRFPLYAADLKTGKLQTVYLSVSDEIQFFILTAVSYAELTSQSKNCDKGRVLADF